uniref:Uncharacterized protein n=1 Tax=Myoviridae sp. ctLYp5 TaxID=2827680 RepID=A0A8S5SXU3_9CAUD|nr:MAG TPA: hypothetical protein [Myoviridae sp. ctLYp5]
MQGFCFIFPITRRRKPPKAESHRYCDIFTSIVSLVFCFDKGFLWPRGL